MPHEQPMFGAGLARDIPVEMLFLARLTTGCRCVGWPLEQPAAIPAQGEGYPERVLTSPSIVRMRRRLPLIVFILLAVLCLVLIGFACACFSDHPVQAIDRAVSAPAATPAVIEVWSFVVLSLLAAPLVVTRRTGGFGRASPAQLQRFLF